jgi:hypothetical protein
VSLMRPRSAPPETSAIFSGWETDVLIASYSRRFPTVGTRDRSAARTASSNCFSRGALVPRKPSTTL